MPGTRGTARARPRRQGPAGERPSRKADHALSEDRGRALELAVARRMKPSARERLLTELASLAAVTNVGDAIVRRDDGRHGYLEVAFLEAYDPPASRYLAVSRLAAGERELYLDALIDGALADRAGVQTITLADGDVGDPRAVAGQPEPRCREPGPLADELYSDAARDLLNTIEGWQDDLDSVFVEVITEAF